VISHLYFGLKTAVGSHILMLGDAAGNIRAAELHGIQYGAAVSRNRPSGNQRLSDGANVEKGDGIELQG